MHAADPTVFVDNDFDDITLSDGVAVASASDENDSSDVTYVVVTDPDAGIPRDVSTILYTEVSPKTAEWPARFDAYVSRGSRSGLKSQA